MEFGQLGHLGPNAVNHVVMVFQQDHDHAMDLVVGEPHVQEAKMKIRDVMRDVVRLMEDGDPGGPGLNVLGAMELPSARNIVIGSVTIQSHNVKGKPALETLLDQLFVADMNVMNVLTHVVNHVREEGK